ncbi:MobC family plasmid mobilization relaxosome protein, partial [Enterobacter hormaechei]|uniref:MobC family plasmid mobilization relaxosome protein n=1 Tax=Enterobacter hormaechei TaxID=158836 RepID=UPI000ABFC589
MLTMWVTEGEHRRLLERCDGRPLAAWMRQTCLDEKPARTGKLPSLSPALLRQLAGMGNNLNQIARRVNAGESEGSFPVRAGFSSRQVCRIPAA